MDLRKAGAIGTLIGASFLPQALADDSGPFADASLPVATSQDDLPESDSVVEIRKTGLTLLDHGTTFIEDSQVLLIHRDLQQKMTDGTGVSEAEVAALFRALDKEPDTDVKPGFLQQYFKQFRSEQVSLAFLTYLDNSPTMGGSHASIHPYLEFDNARIQALALKVLYHNPTVVLPKEEVNKYLSHADSAVRAAALLHGMTRFQEVTPESVSEIVQAAKMLTRYDMHTGHEVQLGQHLRDLLAEVCDVKNIEMPVLHVLCSLDAHFPGYFDKLSPKETQQLCKSVVEEFRLEQQRLSEIIFLEPGMDILLALHEEEPFKPGVIEKFAAKYDATLHSVFKGKQSYDDQGAKESYLGVVEDFSRDNSKKHLIWNLMHGSHNHFWFASGTPGQTDDMDEAEKWAVSAQEMAAALVNPQLDRGSIDLSHICILMEACEQYTVATGIQDEIYRLAEEYNKTVTGLPTMVTISQAHMIGQVLETFYTEESREYDPHFRGYVIRKEEKSYIHGKTEKYLDEVLADDQKVITLADIVAAQKLMGEKLPEFLNSSKVQALLKERALGEEVTFKAFLTEAQDPAVFSPELLPITEFFERCLQRAAGKGVDLPVPEYSDQQTGPKKYLLELGLLEKSKQVHV